MSTISFNGATVKMVVVELHLGEGKSFRYELFGTDESPMQTTAKLRYGALLEPGAIDLSVTNGAGMLVRFDNDTDHLVPELSDRGFKSLPPIASSYPAGEVAVSESSAATWPSIWLRAKAPDNLNEPEGPSHEAPIHLTVGAAWRLAEQLQWLVKNHYQCYGLAALDDEEADHG